VLKQLKYICLILGFEQEMHKMRLEHLIVQLEYMEVLRNRKERKYVKLKKNSEKRRKRKKKSYNV
jgi:hypothetical protein